MSNKQLKKIAMEDEKERSTDLHLYSIVEEKTKDQYHNKPEELYTELITTNENPQTIYSSLPLNKNADYSLTSKSMSEYEQSNKKLKKDKCGYRVWFCSIILVLFLLVLISLVISIVISLTMRSSSAVLSNEEFMKKIENNTQSNSLKILALEKELDEYRKSDLFSFNITNFETFITDRDLDFLVLVQQLNESRNNTQSNSLKILALEKELNEYRKSDLFSFNITNIETFITDHDIDFLVFVQQLNESRNNTQSNSLKILALEKELNEYRKSDLFSFNITNIETFITDRDLDFLVLVQQLNESRNNTQSNSLKILALEKELDEYRKSDLFSFNITNIETLITDHDIDFLVLVQQLNESRNNTQSNSLKILALEKELDEYRKSDLFSFNITNIETFITDRDLDLLLLVQQLNESSVIEHAFLNDRIKQIYRILSGKTVSFPAPSCRAIHILLQAYSVSGYYWVLSSNGSSIRVYCEMTKSCGNVTGGLTRVALLNNKTRPLICTGDFVTVDNDTRCVRSTEEPGCSHIKFSLMNISYSHICGTVEGSWFGLPGGFTGSNRSSSTTINDNYVDGISLTYGSTTNRSHIWTFIADGYYIYYQFCPHYIPSYIGNSYSCLKHMNLCSSTNSCSHAFFKQFHQQLTEDIEMRLCHDGHQTINYEGIFVGNVEIYVW